MPGFRLTKAAKADMLGIGRYTRHRWGRDQMRRYVGGIDARFHDLASQPELGRVYLELPRIAGSCVGNTRSSIA